LPLGLVLPVIPQKTSDLPDIFSLQSSFRDIQPVPERIFEYPIREFLFFKTVCMTKRLQEFLFIPEADVSGKQAEMGERFLGGFVVLEGMSRHWIFIFPLFY